MPISVASAGRGAWVLALLSDLGVQGKDIHSARHHPEGA